MGVARTPLNFDPKHINPELTTSEPYVIGSHATCRRAWARGPGDYAPSEHTGKSELEKAPVRHRID